MSSKRDLPYVVSAFRPTSRRRFLQLSAAAVGGTLLPSTAFSQTRISTTDLGGATLLTGAGCNVVAVPGPDGALMIDGGLAANADALIAAVKAATRTSRIAMLVNTQWHPEQTGANEAVGRAGGVIFAHEKTKTYLSNAVYSVTFKGRRAALPKAAWPTKLVRTDGSMEFAGQKIDYGYMPAAHTDGDLFVHFPQLNVLAAGGVVSAERWPLLEYRDGAWLGGRVRAVEWLADIVKPDTRVVPAQGKLLTGRDIVRQSAIYRELFETMIGYLNKGFGAEDAIRANPLQRYDAEFGDSAAFVDGAFRSMLIAYVPD